MIIGKRYICIEPTCGESYICAHPDQRFCTAACRKKHHNRDMVRGAQLAHMLRQWRKQPRPSKKRQEAAEKRGEPFKRAPSILSEITKAEKAWRELDRMMRNVARNERKLEKEAAE